jgi:hypothetical protein
VVGQGDGSATGLLTSPGGPGGGATAAERTGGSAALVLLAALATALLGRGGYFAAGQWAIGAFLAVALAAALAVSPLSRADLHTPLVPGLGAVAVWAVVVATFRGDAGKGLAPCLLVAGIVTVLVVCRRLDERDRETLVFGVVAATLVVAASGWAGVAFGIDGWRWMAQGVWRASSTLTYPNAAAAVLVPVTLLVVALLTDQARSVPLGVAATGLLVGTGATMSRAGLLALAAGLVVLMATRGARAVASTVTGPIVGAVVGLGALLASSPTSEPTKPWLATAGLLTGLAIGVGAARMAPKVFAGLAATVCVVAVVAAFVVDAVGEVADARFTPETAYRFDGAQAAWGVISDHPLAGAGPGMAELRWTGRDGATGMLRYAHNEYLQVVAELGLVGAVAVVIVLVALAQLLWLCRCEGGELGARWAGVVAGCCAFAVHSAFDFIWHIPAVPLLVAVLVGLAVPPVASPAPAAVAPGPSSRRSHRQKGAR